MGARKVYPVQCYNGSDLKVIVGEERVSMEEFLQKHTPIQVTSLIPFNHNEPLLTVGLLIAEEDSAPTKAKTAKLPESHALSKRQGGGKRAIEGVFK